MLWSDGVGILASLVLVIPPAKDNFYRFMEAHNLRKRENSPWPGLRSFIITAWREKRDAFSFWDSIFMIGGALGLAFSFLLKALEL